MLLLMYQVFSSLLGHLPFSVHLFLHFYGVTFFGTPNINSRNAVDRNKNVSIMLVTTDLLMSK